MSLWNWLNGKKTVIGAGLSLLDTYVAPLVGIPPATVTIINQVAQGIMGLGLLHKAAKASKGGKAPTVTPLLLIAAAAVLVSSGGCAALKDKMPEARFEVSAFGVSLGVDTRKVTDPVLDTAQAATDAVGLTTPTEAPKK